MQENIYKRLAQAEAMAAAQKAETMEVLQADIIQKQAEAIAQAEIAESVAADLAEMRKQAADTLARCEKEL